MPVEMAPQAPKRSAAPKRTAVTAKQDTASRMTARSEAVNGIFQITAVGCVARGWYADAGAIAQHGPKISAELVTLAETDSRIASLVDYLATAGPYTGLLLAVLPLAFQIAVNHKRMDPKRIPLPGITDPEILENSVRREMATAGESA
jgi:hypothetical protein